jgi:hypothetical protein
MQQLTLQMTKRQQRPMQVQVAPAEVLFERGALSKGTAKLLARPPMPTVLTGLTHRTEFPSPEDSPNLLTKLVGVAFQSKYLYLTIRLQKAVLVSR